ncbi:MAG: 1-acyl-sn-glycerol-3-phosphate acyltransferase [Leptospiraceae bacterium]|nr:1-acyl-sn-glycerol-3-phosphate acyltransferase [Leptospiraceae bacterium]MCK6379737.1 1-acyl-sn-glycerol-3-phosphate acyltransferase [Leptospiraceae bacterium]NUM41678.1 1-acyl-sn-glycerol-3-phosphate acyltransferase [Leptospiraceae bacterium]
MSIESFIPPKQNFPTLWFTDLSLPILIKTIHNLDDIVVRAEDILMLRSLKDERLIYASNHPTTKEPPVAYHVANLMNTRFFYMAAREVFDWGMGFVGDFIQSIGAFSVLAGTTDRDSLKTARSILASPAGKLVLFPEGEPTGAENDNLLPFQPGVSQLGFWALEDAKKVSDDADIVVLPSYVKYRMKGSIDSIKRDIDHSIEVMENTLGISKTGKNITHRLLSVGKKLVERAEKEFGITPKESESFDYRIGHLRHAILNDIAEKIDIRKWDEKDHAIDKLRKILTTIELTNVGIPDPKNELPTIDAARWARLACQRAYDFIAIKVDYLTSLPSAERIYEWIYRFENELFGRTNPRANIAYVHYATPFKLSEYLEEYKKDKKKTVEKMTLRLRSDIEKLLEKEKSLSKELYESDFLF